MVEKTVTAKVIIQQCLEASLRIAEETALEPAKYVKIGRGAVVYVCFMKEASLDTVEKIISSITTVKLSKNDESNLVSISDLPGSLLIVPQATLGGKLKGKRMQYHNLIEKSAGLTLYEKLVENCRASFSERIGNKVSVECGVYGNLQVLSMITNGPYTHIIEFS